MNANQAFATALKTVAITDDEKRMLFEKIRRAAEGGNLSVELYINEPIAAKMFLVNQLLVSLGYSVDFKGLHGGQHQVLVSWNDPK